VTSWKRRVAVTSSRAAVPLALAAVLVTTLGPSLTARGRASGTAEAATPGLAAAVARPGSTVIARAWHGKTPREKADEYERYLTAAVTKFRSIPGNLGYDVMRLDDGPGGAGVVEFQVISYWESLDAIKAYAGDDVRRTHSLPRDPEFLVDLEPWVRNYRLKVYDIAP
jgi:heme-degrading monooxygenase HmoA